MEFCQTKDTYTMHNFLMEGVHRSVQLVLKELSQGSEFTSQAQILPYDQYCICEPSGKVDTVKLDTSCGVIEDGLKTETKRKLRIEELELDTHKQALVEALEGIYKDSDIVIFRRKKGDKRINLSSKRSAYIGVSKNGPNWQALITIGKRKTYIGTYDSEIEAARGFDKYAILLHGLKAKTNYNYSKQEVMQIVSSL